MNDRRCNNSRLFFACCIHFALLVDPDAQLLTINYAGGSIEMPVGNLKSLFGENYELLVGEPEPVVSVVPSHPRVRIIGGASTQVKEHTREFNQWPTSNATNAGAGRRVLIDWEDSGGMWSARISGTCAALADFLQSNTSKICKFRTSRGKKYGPFNNTSN